jgi:hypothetical protein
MVGVKAYFKDLGAVKGLAVLEGATSKFNKSLKDMQDKTWKATGNIRDFADGGKEAAISMSAGLARTAVLQGKVYTQTSDIMSQQLDASVGAAENVDKVQELQAAFEDTGKAAIKDIGAMAKLQRVTEIPARSLASWDKTLEAQGMTEDQVISLTKQMVGLGVQLHVPPGPLLSNLDDSTKLLLARASALGKDGPKFIAKYMRENTALSAALTSTGANAEEASSSVYNLGKLSFDSAKEMKAAMAGVASETPEFLQFTGVTLGNFQKGFELAAENGPLALVKAFREQTEQIRLNSKDDPRAMDNWRMWLDKTINDPVMVAGIVDQHGKIGEAITVVNKPIGDSIKAYDDYSDAVFKNADALRQRRDVEWDAIKTETAQKAIIPFMTRLWSAQTWVMDQTRVALRYWTADAGSVKAEMASLAGVTLAYGGDMLDWGVKAGGMVKNLGDLKTSVYGLASAITGQGVASMGQLLLAMGPLIAIVAGFVALLALVDKALATNAAASEKAGKASLAYADAQTKAFTAGVKLSKSGDTQAAIMTKTLVHIAKEKATLKKRGLMAWDDKVQYERLNVIESRLQGKVAARASSGTTKVEAHSPTPVGSSGAFPPGASNVRVAIQDLEAQRAQTHLLEQIASLLGGAPTAGAASSRGGGGITVEIRPDSGPMQLHKMLRATARTTMGRTGYNQFGGEAFAN